MAITREKKEKLVEQYVEQLKSSEAIIITDYRSLTVPDLQELRAEIRKAEGSFSVIKNTLIRRALEESGFSIPEELLKGPVGVGFCSNNIPGVAKAITNFAKDHEALVVKGGLMGGNRIIDETAIKNLASLPPIEVLRAQILGLINAPASQLVGVVVGGVRQVVNVVNAYATKEDDAAPAEA